MSGLEEGSGAGGRKAPAGGLQEADAAQINIKPVSFIGLWMLGYELQLGGLNPPQKAELSWGLSPFASPAFRLVSGVPFRLNNIKNRKFAPSSMVAGKLFPLRQE